MMEPSPTAENSVAWEQKTAGHFVFCRQANSDPDGILEQVEEFANRVYQRGSEYLGEENPIRFITIYLTDTLDPVESSEWEELEDCRIAKESRTIWQLIDQKCCTEHLARAILEILFRSSPYPRSLSSEALLNALAFLIVHEPDLAAETGEDTAALRRLFDHKVPRLFAHEKSQARSAAEASFFAFLERSHGHLDLVRFVRTSFMSEPDLAAPLVYARSLDDLVKDWFAELNARSKTSTKLSVMLRLSLPLLRPHWRKLAELITLMGFDLVFGLAIPLSAKYLYDDVIATRRYDLLVVWVIAVLVIFAVGSFASYRRIIVGNLVGELILRDLRKSVFAHLQILPLKFYTRTSTGDTLSRLTHDTDRVQLALGQHLPDLVFQTFSIIAFSITLVSLNWMLGLFVLFLGIPTYALVYRHLTERLRAAERDHLDHTGEVAAFVQENLSAQLLVKTLSLGDRTRAAFELHLQRLFASSLHVNRLQANMFGLVGVISLGLRILIMAVGALLVMRQSLSVGNLIAFVALITQALNQIVAITTRYQRLQSATGAFSRVQELMAERTEAVEVEKLPPLPDLQKEIRLEQVTFQYHETGTPALRDVTLSISAGSRVAIVGSSGSGKSTLIGLLLRLQEPTSGGVLFDGRDVSGFSLESLRHQIAIVPQDTLLFNASVEENIALGREKVQAGEVMAAAKAAQIHDFVLGLESGYQTSVGERGARLSGGQRQRLAIARALIRDPRILILDEATSALDAATESDILQTVEKVGVGRTVIMITHRLTSVIGCDYIFVLNHGRIVEQGKHQEMVNTGGLYQRLYEEQTRLLKLSIREANIQAMRLQAIPLFARAGSEALAAVAEHLILERYLPGEVIVRQGDPGDFLYVIGAGMVEVLDGTRQIRTMAEGDYFGEIALLASGIRTATVRAVSATQLYGLSKVEFVRLIESEPQIRQAVMHRLKERYSDDKWTMSQYPM